MTYLAESIHQHELQFMIFWHDLRTEEVAWDSYSLSVW